MDHDVGARRATKRSETVSPRLAHEARDADGQDPSPPHIKQELDPENGRPRSRSHDKDSNDNADDEQGGDGGNSSNSDGPVRKRRRSRKGLDKKFECPHEGCGKSYSRAEHL